MLFAGVDFPKVIARPDTAYFRNDVMRRQIGVGGVPAAVKPVGPAPRITTGQSGFERGRIRKDLCKWEIRSQGVLDEAEVLELVDQSEILAEGKRIFAALVDLGGGGGAEIRRQPQILDFGGIQAH